MAGALDDLPGVTHRRDALWQAELPLHDDLLASPPSRPATTATSVGRQSGASPVRQAIPATTQTTPASPLAPMSAAETLAADLATTGATTGPHPLALWRRRAWSEEHGAESMPGTRHPAPVPARDLHGPAHGTPVTVAGMVICRQRPGTAKGHCFISLEDETGIANLFIPRDTFRRLRLVITTERFLLARGRLQIPEGGQPTVYVTDLAPLPGIAPDLAARSHDFH
jgi:error-prone DNA polymerase